MTSTEGMPEWALVPEDCPSELALDQLVSDELTETEATKMRAHATGCDRCGALLAEREAGMDAVPELAKNRDAIVAAVSAAVATREPGMLERLRLWFAELQRPMIAMAAVAAVALVVVITQREPGEDIRSKGGVALTVFRERGGAVHTVADGDMLQAGDRLRFRVQAPAEGGKLMVVGVESSGSVFPYYPADGVARSPELDPEGTIADAVALDTSTGAESIQLVWCPTGFAVSALAAGGPHDGVRAPKGCRTAMLRVTKQ